MATGQTLQRNSPVGAPLPSTWQRWAGPLTVGIVFSATLAFLSMRGLADGVSPQAGLSSVLLTLMHAGLPAISYLLAAWGWGRPIVALCAPRHPFPLTLQLAAGVAVLLTLSHALAVTGLLSWGESGLAAAGRTRMIALIPIGIGVALLADQFIRGPLRPERWPRFSPTLALSAGPAALLAVAASNPPGWIWESEFAGFDALSYHLQLPKEYLAGDRMWPLEHNVYSYLPNYVEAAYLHLGAICGGGGGALEPCTGPMIGGDGNGTLAAQMLHALFMVSSTLIIGATCLSALRRARVPNSLAKRIALIAAAAAIATPWSIVTGSLAYDEGAVLLLLAGGLLLALNLDEGTSHWRTGMIGGLLLGAAVSSKLSAVLVGAPVVGIVFLAESLRLRKPMLLLGIALAGMIVVSPWLIRNGLACGNPVFPFLANWFGSAHWTAEQVSRYSAGHHDSAPLLARLGFALSTERGILHPQWSVFFVMGLLAIITGLMWKPARGIASLLAVGVLVSIIGWLCFTHVQARFLTPLAPALSLAFALGGAAVLWILTGGNLVGIRTLLVTTTFALAPIGMTAVSVRLFLRQAARVPNLLLPGGVLGLTGSLELEKLAAASPQEQQDFLGSSPLPLRWLNILMDDRVTGISAVDSLHIRDGDVYLLGDSTPYYTLGAVPRWQHGRRVIYHSTWDRSPLGEVIRNTPEGLRNEARFAFWARALRTQGIRFILVNFNELERLCERDGWYDPDVTPAVARELLRRHGRLVRSWPAGLDPADRGVFFYEVLDSPPQAPPAAAPAAAPPHTPLEAPIESPSQTPR